MQKIAVEKTRLSIPLLAGFDVLHGHRTIFPIPLAEAASSNLACGKRAPARRRSRQPPTASV